MNRIFLLAALLITAQIGMAEAVATAIDQTDKPSRRTDVITKSFSGLETCNGIPVEFIYDPGAKQTTCDITGIGVADLVERIKPRVQGGTLVIATHDGRGLYNGGPSDGRPAPHVTVTSPYKLKSINANSGSSLSIKNNISMAQTVNFDVSSGARCTIKKLSGGESMKIEASSGGELSIGTVGSSKISIEATSGAKISLGGTARSINISAGSGATMHLQKLVAHSLSATASSGATILYRQGIPSTRIDAGSGAVVAPR